MKIFLDIDGILVHGNSAKAVESDADGFYKFNDAAVLALQSICANHPSHEIILSSSHRFRYSLDEWKNIFQSRGIVINTISRVESPLDFTHTRKMEILDCISSRAFKTAEIMIIDDDKSLNGLPDELKERLILTDPYIGLHPGLLKIR